MSQHQERPFTHLSVPAIASPPAADITARWIVPLYMNFFTPSAEPILNTLWPEMTSEIAHQLLAYFNWRPRVVGAYVVALKRFHQHTDLVGRLLLRSDVCFAGRAYCLALARLNTSESRHYLHEYLGYYLKRPDLDFDQREAMAAVAYLDDVNGTRHAAKFAAGWSAFTKTKSHLELEDGKTRFASRMAKIGSLADKLA